MTDPASDPSTGSGNGRASSGDTSTTSGDAGAGSVGTRLGLKTQLVRFVAAGAISAVVDFGVLWVLMRVGLDHTPAKAVSFVAGTTTAYLINRRWTFGSAGSTKTFLSVMLLYGTTFVVQVGLFAVLYPPIERMWGVTVAQVLGFVIAQGVATTVNFVVQRAVIFRHRGEGSVGSGS